MNSEYQEYLKDQIDDTPGAGIDHKYLNFLLLELLPNFDYHNAKVLDVGAGKFMSWDFFKENFQNEIVGIDINRAGLEFCREQDKKGMIELDAHEMCEKLVPNQFNLVISFHTLEHMFDLPRVLRNCLEVLKETGYFFFAIPMPSYNWKKGHWYDIPTPKFMLDLCRRIGFKEVFWEVFGDSRFRPEREMVCLLRK